MKQCDAQTTINQNLQPSPPNAKIDPKKAGLFYTILCIAVQLLGYAVVFLINAVTKSETSAFAQIARAYAGCSAQIIILLGVIIFLAVNKTKPTAAGFRKTDFLPCIIGVLFALSISYSSAPEEFIFQEFLKLFGYEDLNVISDLPMEGGLVFLALFAVALLPAIGEEFMFRGIILEGTKRFGTLQACLINGFLFSLFHCNPSQTCYTFLAGAAWALVAIRCNSILPTMIAHFISNGMSILMLYFGTEAMPEIVLILIYLAAGTATALGLIYFLDYNKSNNVCPSERTAPFWKRATGGVVFNFAVWILTFVLVITSASL